MVKAKSTYLQFYLFIFFLFTAASSAKYTPLLWERPIYDALNSRDEYYKRVGIKHDNATLNMLLTSKGSLALKEQLDLHKEENSPWYQFLCGIVNLRSSDNSEIENFLNTIKYATDEPGILWVLFLEFYQTRQIEWADSCLKQLEKHFLSIGGQSAPIISQQLLAIAKSEIEKGNNLSFRKYIEESARFEQYPFWQIFMQGWVTLPQNPPAFINACKECINMIRASWLLQITLLNYLFTWFWFSIFFLLLIIFVTICIEILPIALHQITEIFPPVISSYLRYLLALVMLISLTFIGIIPFFLITIFIMWPYAKKWKKIFLVFCLSLLVSFPLDARIRDMFRVSLSTDTSLGLFRKVISEGWHSDLEDKILQKLKIDDRDYLSYTSAAILDLKKNRIPSSINRILEAEKLKTDDPVILTTAGNIYYAADDLNSAQKYYKKCSEIFPDYAPGRFNLGQLNFYMKKMSESTEQVSCASDLNPDLVNKFIDKNAYYFPDSLPILRQFMQADYSPGYFWRKVFPLYWGSWEGAKKIWGLNFFGVSPLLTPLLILTLIILFMLFSKIKSHSVNLLFCKLCGRLLCKKCSIGHLCRNCIQMTESTHEELQKKQLKSKIKNRAQRQIQNITIILNLLFPGAGELYKESNINFSGIFLITITACIYATYVAFFTFDFSYPFWVVKNCFTFLFLCLLIYNLYFVIVSIKDLIMELRSKEDKHVISWKS